MPEWAQKRNRGLFLAAIRPMRQLSKRYAQAQRASARGLRGVFPLKPMADRANRLQCSALHFCASAGRGGRRAAFQLLLLDKWGHFRSKVGFKPGFLRLALLVP